jgi:hypothetical protein
MSVKRRDGAPRLSATRALRVLRSRNQAERSDHRAVPPFGLAPTRPHPKVDRGEGVGREFPRDPKVLDKTESGAST